MRKARAGVERPSVSRSPTARQERYEYGNADNRATRQPRVQVRLRHRRRAGRRAPWSERGRDPADLGEEAGACVAARLAAEGVSHVADDEGANLGQRQVRADRLSEHHLLLRTEEDQRRRTQLPAPASPPTTTTPLTPPLPRRLPPHPVVPDYPAHLPPPQPPQP